MLLCVLLLVPGAVTASTPITGPTVITAPGSYYLENDIQNCTEPVAILIQCSNVVLDGKGKTIDGTDKAGSVGIRIYNAAMTLVNVVVRNVICSDWTNGVYLTDVKNSVFEKITATSNSNYGVLVEHSTGNTFNKLTLRENGYDGGYDGILLYSSSNQNTIKNTLSEKNEGSGLRIRYSNGNVVQMSKFLDNEKHGISLDNNANYNTLTQNTITKNGNNGIYMHTDSNYNTISKNTITGNKWTGIYLLGSDYNIISENTVRDSGTVGIYLNEESEDNSVINNVIRNSTANGIVMKDKSNDNVIANNTIDKNAMNGILINAVDKNVIYNNVVRENKESGVWVGGYSKNNVIFNNYFYNDNNTKIVTTNTNTWNLTYGEVKSITNGKFSGGNSWGQPNGQGFSQITPDLNKDGICDNPYKLATNNIDNLPLKFNINKMPITTVPVKPIGLLIR